MDGTSRWTHGPSFEEGGIRFRLWDPAHEHVSLALENRSSTIPMERRDGGFFEILAEGIGAGALYRFELSDGRRVPYPASRFQPHDVHGPSETIDLSLIAGARTGRVGPGTTLCSMNCTSDLSRRKAFSRPQPASSIISSSLARQRSRSCRSPTSAGGGAGAMTGSTPTPPTRPTGGPRISSTSSRRPTGAASRFWSTSSTIISDQRGITFRLSHPTSSPTAIGRLGAKRSISRGRRAPRPRLRHRERGILDRRVSPGRTAPRCGAFDQGRQPSGHRRRNRLTAALSFGGDSSPSVRERPQRAGAARPPRPQAGAL